MLLSGKPEALMLRALYEQERCFYDRQDISGQGMPLEITDGTKESEGDSNHSTHGGGSWDAATIVSGEDRLFTSNFIFATLANFVSSFSTQMLTAILPVYVISLGGSQTEAGLVNGAIALTAVLFRPFLGWLTDAWRRRPVVLTGISFQVLASTVYLLAGSIPILILGRLVQGLGLSCYSTASNVYVADIAPLQRRAEAVGFFAAAQAVGLVVGPVVGFVIVAWTGFHHLFYFTGGLAITALCCSAFTREPRQDRKIKPQPWSLRTGIVSVDALPLALTALCMGIGYGSINAFISIFAQSRGVQNPGYYFMVQAVALLFSRTLAGRLADRAGRAVVIVPGVILMSAASAMLPLAHGFPWFFVSASLFGIGFGSAQPATMALLVDRVRPEQRGLATGTYFTGFDTGFIIGTILLGVVGQKWDFGVMWSISAVCTLLSLAGIVADRRHSH
jgi:MFS family permease